MKIKFRKTKDNAKVPTKATNGSGAYDLYTTSPAVVYAGDSQTLGTGIAMEIPEGFVGLVCPRSGLADKNKLTVLNGPGVIDSDYRGEVGVIIHNTAIGAGGTSHVFQAGAKVGQILFVKAEAVEFEEADVLTETQRGEGGYGSTGQ